MKEIERRKFLARAGALAAGSFLISPGAVKANDSDQPEVTNNNARFDSDKVQPFVGTVPFFNVRDYGAIGDGITLNTKAIQETIDDASKNGGGIVYFPPGRYLSGSIVLKDFILLRFEVGSFLLGSLDLKDYPADLGLVEMIKGTFFAGPLIYAEDAQHIGIEGKGIIDGRGTRENFDPHSPLNIRPGLVRFRNCRFVSVKDVSLVNSARWTLHLRECEDVSVSNIYLNSNVNRNNDGIDIDSSHRVKIIGCHLNSEDDAIVCKSYAPNNVRDIVVADCILSSGCSAFKIGTETVGKFENISISNCVIYGSRGINLFTMDGADINNVNISNISMRDCKSAIQLRLGGRMRPYNMQQEEQPKSPGQIRNIMISNVQAHNIAESQDFISGIPGHHLENIMLSNIRISYKGGGTKEMAQREIPEEIAKYPKIGMFGDLPSYGFYIRHVDGITVRNVHLDYIESDLRPAIVCDDVSNLEISGSQFKGNEDGDAVIRLSQVTRGNLKENQVKNGAKTFFHIKNGSKEIILQGNLYGNVKELLSTNNVDGEQVKKYNNIN